MLRPFFHTITDLSADAELVRARRYGIIVVRKSQLEAIHFRPWPKMISRLEVMTIGRYVHQRSRGDYCWLYYNAPLTAPDFLSLVYVVSGKETTWRTFRTALATLDEVARLRNAAAIVTDVSNPQISERNLSRNGWEPHCAHLPGRNYIKRFYGDYPRLAAGTHRREVLAS
ncbi:hypothetical protein LOC68_23715 [Blastopirellula sp. JC732]|uniref:Uncharacterized protein n=1 Tax=Blastopirellula sediminis TaxID=2894196 RepID=A0A9X1MQ57_9BACT|nr:hypothetical protein [Blastopirellula sediminis]MCC9605287.1 hypothetical protein [Blastopirellula sediminis]MCC9631413.1 hypothetical protein [Blastopirellula sediminis]